MDSEDHVYSEKEVVQQFGDAYDLHKEEGDPEQSPYRALKSWYLVTADDPDKPVPLPTQGKFNNHVLHGVLQGRDVEPIHIQVPLTKLNTWVIDRTHERRGIWIQSGADPTVNAWYWLHNAHRDKQDRIHQPIRAKLGLLNNVIDLMEESHNGIPQYYAAKHWEKTPKQLHNALTCADDAAFTRFRSNHFTTTSIFQEPFDYTLLNEQGGLSFLKTHMEGLHGYANSKFSKELNKMKGKKTKQWSSDQFRASAKVAEERSQRRPWGEPLEHPKAVSRNWIIEAKLGQAGEARKRRKPSKDDDSDEEYREHPPSAKTPERRPVIQDSDDDDDVAPPKKKQKRVVDEQVSTADSKSDFLAEAQHSDERMVEALNQLKDMLTPTLSSDETGKWKDVDDKKFRVKDKASAIAIVDFMMKHKDDLSDECKLLIVTAFRNVCSMGSNGKEEKKILTQLFKKKGNGIVIFEIWKREAMEKLENLAQVKGEVPYWYQDIDAFRLLNEYIRFIKGCFVVSKKAEIDKLNDTYKVEWNHPTYLNDVKEFESKHAHTSNTLRASSTLTQTHLKRMMSPKPVPSTSAPPAAGASASSPSSEGARFTNEATGTSDDSEVEKKKKHAEERRKKMLEMTKNKNAQLVASHQAAAPAPQQQATYSQGISQNTAKLGTAAASDQAKSNALPANWSVWKNEPRVIDASKEQWVPVEGNEPFFVKTLPPVCQPRDESKPTTRPVSDNRGGAQPPPQQGTARNETSRGPAPERQPSSQDSDRRAPRDEKDVNQNYRHRDSDDSRPRRDDYRSTGSDRRLDHGDEYRSRRSRSRSYERRRPESMGYDRGSDRRRTDDRRDRSPDRRSMERRSDGRLDDRHMDSRRSRDSSYRERSPDRRSAESRMQRHPDDRPDDGRGGIGSSYAAISPDRRSMDRSRNGRQPDDRQMGDWRDGGSEHHRHKVAAGYGFNYDKPAVPDSGRSFVLSANYDARTRGGASSSQERIGNIRQEPRINDRQDRGPAFGAAMEAPGAGRGRGKHMTQPAWMAKGTARAKGPTATERSSPPVASTTSQPNVQQQSVSGVPHGRTNTSQPTGVREQGAANGAGRGRGRHITQPAWMTKGTASANGPAAAGSSSPPVASTTSQPNVQQQSVSGVQYGMSTSKPTGMRGQGAASGAGRGRGRGQHMTKPAWMTRGQV